MSLSLERQGKGQQHCPFPFMVGSYPQLSSTVLNCPQLSLSQLLKRKPEKALSCVGLSLIECASMKMIYHRPTYSIGHQVRTSHTPQLPFSTQINPFRCAAAPLLRSVRDSCPITPILVLNFLGLYCPCPYLVGDLLSVSLS